MVSWDVFNGFLVFFWWSFKGFLGCFLPFLVFFWWSFHGFLGGFLPFLVVSYGGLSWFLGCFLPFWWFFGGLLMVFWEKEADMCNNSWKTS